MQKNFPYMLPYPLSNNKGKKYTKVRQKNTYNSKGYIIQIEN